MHCLHAWKNYLISSYYKAKNNTHFFPNSRSFSTSSGIFGGIQSVVIKHNVPPNYQQIPFAHLLPVDRLDENYDGRKVIIYKKNELRRI
jgi:hypothetical protein